MTLFSRRSQRRKDPSRNAEESCQDDSLPFSIDDDPSGLEAKSSFARHRPFMKSTFGFSVNKRADMTELSNSQDNIDTSSTYNTLAHKREKHKHTGFRPDKFNSAAGKLKEFPRAAVHRPISALSKDSLESVDQDYVIVSGPPLDESSSSQTASKRSHLPCTLEHTRQACAPVNSMSCSPTPTIGTGSRSLESHGSVPSQGSMDMGDALEQPSNCLTRIKSLQRFASAIKELVNEKVEGGRQLEAFSIQLVILAIWKQVLHICHTQAVPTIEGSPTHDGTNLRVNSFTIHDSGGSDSANTWDPQDMCSQIEREFLAEV